MIDLQDLLQNKITKRYLYSVTSSDEILRHFYNKDIVLGQAIKSPLREDNTPSFAFYRNKNKDIIFYDFGNGDSGSVIDFVSKLFNVSYRDAIKIILSDMNIDRNINSYSTEVSLSSKVIENSIIEQQKSIKVKIRKFNANDILYWNSFGISLKTLELFNVKAVSHIFLNNNIFLADKLAYVYAERIRDSRYIKIYQPYGKIKWLTNMKSKVLFAYSRIPEKGNLLIITKALKEIMSLYETVKIPAIGVQSEHIIIKPHVLADLQSRFTNIVTMFDNDEQGIKLRDKYRLLGINGITFQEAKNYSDLIEDKGIKYSKEKLNNKLWKFIEH